jgi:hypothetical protein
MKKTTLISDGATNSRLSSSVVLRESRQMSTIFDYLRRSVARTDVLAGRAVGVLRGLGFLLIIVCFAPVIVLAWAAYCLDKLNRHC